MCGLGSFSRVVGSNPTGCILQFHFQRKRGRVGSKILAAYHESLKAAVQPNGNSFDFGSEVWGSIPTGCAFIFFYFSYLLFAFRREVSHLTWSRSFGAVGEYSNSPLLIFSPFGFPQSFFSTRVIFNIRVIFNSLVLGCVLTPS